MDRYCEFCVNLRSIVYCKADTVYLCLSCDTKVHSANPLSNRHYRNLICESCRRRPTYVRCYDHQKFMCRGCDLSQHNASSKHRKKVVKSYVGCPSARDLGVLWDFDLNQGFDGGIQVISVLEQLVDLLKVQTSDVDHNSFVTRCQQHDELENDVDRFSQQLLFKNSFPFTHLDHLESSETSLEDSLFQWKSCVSSSQLWCHNMQDLGVCEEPSCLDYLDIPDIDHTFRNFEELFRNEEEAIRVDQDTSMAFSFSRSNTTCIDDGVSTEHHEPAKSEGKKIIHLKDSEQSQCGHKKARSDTHKRTKSQTWKLKILESTTKSG